MGKSELPSLDVTISALGWSKEFERACSDDLDLEHKLILLKAVFQEWLILNRVMTGPYMQEISLMASHAYPPEIFDQDIGVDLVGRINDLEMRLMDSQKLTKPYIRR